MESIINRNEAYKSIIGELPERRQYIFQMLEQVPNSSAWDIADITEMPFNQVAARITELKDLFLIIEVGSKINPKSKKSNTLYRVVTNLDERIDLINEAFVEYRENKEKLERDYHAGVSTLTKAMIKKEIDKIKYQINSLSKILDYGKAVVAE